MNRSAFSRSVDAAVGHARDTRPAVPRAPSSAPSLGVGDPSDLVARALAILAEGSSTSQAHQGANSAPRSARCR